MTGLEDPLTGRTSQSAAPASLVTFRSGSGLSLAAQFQGTVWTLTALRGRTAREPITFRCVRKETRKTETEERIHFTRVCVSPFSPSFFSSLHHRSEQFKKLCCHKNNFKNIKMRACNNCRVDCFKHILALRFLH